MARRRRNPKRGTYFVHDPYLGQFMDFGSLRAAAAFARARFMCDPAADCVYVEQDETLVPIGSLRRKNPGGWSRAVTKSRRYHTPPGLFLKGSRAIASGLLDGADGDHHLALARLQFYINRAGSRLSNRKAVLGAKPLLLNPLGRLKPEARLSARARKGLRRGARVEREHTRDARTARIIASHHLAELPDYYERLAKMERGNPYPHEHAARLIDPAQILPGTFRRKNVKAGAIGLILGKTSRGGPMRLQAVRFRKAHYTAAQAKAWLRRYELSPILFEPATATRKAAWKAEGTRAKRARSSRRRARRAA